jgi:tRNA A-37 threonylcarbamoyl transferase component Bud32
VALLLLEGPRGLFQGWLGLEDVAGSTDLATRFASESPPTSAELGAALRAVRRMHDAGVEHRDLNLGNLLVGEAGADGPRAFVIDLDRARCHAAALPFAARQAALRRLERSYVKSGPPGHARDEIRDGLYSLYAGDDARLASRLAKGRRVGRGWIRVHRLGWRR